MTLQETRRNGTGAQRRSTRSPRPAAGDSRTAGVVRPEEQQPLGNVGTRIRDGVGGWLKSPALDFYGLIVIGALLVGVGLTMVLSSTAVLNISRGESGFAGLFRQGAFAGLGLILLIAAAVMPPGFYRRAAWPLMGLGLLLQCLVFTPLGIEADGNRNWVRLAGQTLQPSEFLKLSLAVWLGALLATKRPLLDKAGHVLFPMVPGVVAALGLVMLGQDLGTMMVMAMLVAGSLWVAGIPRRWFIVSGVLGLVGIVALTVTSANRMHRINNWLHGTCEGDSCLQADQGLMGLAEGGWWGVGLGESRQKWGRLPAAEDDYIFAIIGEELGQVGTLGVLALFAALALVMFRMITRLDEPFMQISVAGISAWLLGQAFLNMMVVTGMLPVIGVPLPFISSGGSALLASMAALGVLLSFARREPGAREAITARVGAVRRSISVLPAPRDAEVAPARGRSSRTRSAGAASTKRMKRAKNIKNTTRDGRGFGKQSSARRGSRTHRTRGMR